MNTSNMPAPRHVPESERERLSEEALQAYEREGGTREDIREIRGGCHGATGEPYVVLVAGENFDSLAVFKVNTDDWSLAGRAAWYAPGHRDYDDLRMNLYLSQDPRYWEVGPDED